jgi:hypothetical protein
VSSPQSGDSWFGTVDVVPPAVRRTNPLAIVSLVLGVVWCGGIGSLFAVVFSIQARRSIRRSGGAETGDGLAIAGLVLGIVGIIGAVLTTLLVIVAAITAGNAAHDAIQRFSHRQVEVRVGKPVTLAASDFAVASGIQTVTVFAVMQPVAALDPSNAPAFGKEFAVADIRVCAVPAGSQEGLTASLFNLVFSGGDRVSASDTAVAKQPNLLDIQGFGPRQCSKGYMTFEIAAGTRPTSVTFEPGPLLTYEWKLPAGLR